MSVGEILQESLVKANGECHNWHDIIERIDERLLDIKGNLQRAQTQKASVDSVYETRKSKYLELLKYCNGLSDSEARNALTPDVEERRQEINRMAQDTQNAGESVRQWQGQMAEIERKRATASSNLLKATERWEQIKRQIEDVNR